MSSEDKTFLFTSESVGEGHPGITSSVFINVVSQGLIRLLFE